ncbi:kinase-like domain-containing protein [Phascolomyces articulosus]|uniref:Aurora kinase n=1 Tax=Phascolomyces articulosus TaxID=60185 RepID=A0AAD5P7T2_9FUNG|nr:kinase-like domain-containing protein [Phascolomyces articulosus]
MTIDTESHSNNDYNNDTYSVASTPAPLSAYVDYTPRRKILTPATTAITTTTTTPIVPLEQNGVSLSRQHRAQHFHQLAQQEEQDDAEDYMNTPVVRRYHGITSEVVPIKVDMNNRLHKSVMDTKNMDRQWCLDDFNIGKHLGSGRFGTVYLAQEKKSDTVVALKIVKKQELQMANVVRFLKREIEIQSHLRHTNVLKLYGYFDDNENVYMVLENAPGCSLYDIVIEGPIPEDKVAKYMIQILAALRYIHKLGVIHRDIKPENILIGEGGELKLADFGWAVHDRRPRRRTFCGTLDYLPPEMIENKCHDEKVDIWALGIMCYELLVGIPPFEDMTGYVETYSRIIKIKYTFPSNISMNAQQFILRHDPRQRPTLEVLENHPWLQQSRDQ